MKSLVLALAGIALWAVPIGALHAQTPSDAPPVSGAGDQQPGGLAAHDVIGKHLNDADGNPLGQIVGVSKDGTTAEVRQGGRTTSVSMSELSLGTGARTVIKGDVPPSNTPNWSRSSTTITSTTTAPPVVVVPPQ